LFVMTAHKFTIFDITNLNKREKKSEMNVELNDFSTGIILNLSPDDQTLFVRSDNAFLIIDISDHSSPIQIFRKEYTLLMSSSLAVSSDAKTLYLLATFNFAIYDLSDKKNPDLLHQEACSANTIDLSKDDSKIVIGTLSKGFKVLDVTDPRSPTLHCSVDASLDSLTTIAFSSEGNKILLSGSIRDSNQLYLQVFGGDRLRKK
ncbi:MAG: hypothetical protein EOP48_30210, partial [Sphingobacteriales bacterium]